MRFFTVFIKLLLLAVFADATFAQDSGTSMFLKALGPRTQRIMILSIYFLSLLFGYVSEDTLKFGASVSVASIMLGYFNTGILLFVGIFVTYSMISSVITSAQRWPTNGAKS